VSHGATSIKRCACIEHMRRAHTESTCIEHMNRVHAESTCREHMHRAHAESTCIEYIETEAFKETMHDKRREGSAPIHEALFVEYAAWMYKCSVEDMR
jgi:hypothetical protein